MCAREKEGQFIWPREGRNDVVSAQGSSSFARPLVAATCPLPAIRFASRLLYKLSKNWPFQKGNSWKKFGKKEGSISKKIGKKLEENSVYLEFKLAW